MSGGPTSRAREQALRAAVSQFQGCLSELPEKLRLTLVLRTGLGIPHALSPNALAARLHVKAAQVPGLEAQAVRQLREAGAGGCGGAGSSGGTFVFTGFDGVGGTGAPMGAVDAVRYTLKPTGPSRFPGSGSSSLLGSALGADIPPAASDAILTVLLILAGAAAMSLLIASEAGRAPSLRRLRGRRSRRPTRRP